MQDKLDREQTETNIQSVKDRLDMIAKSLSDMSKKTRRIEVIDAISVEGSNEVDVRQEAENGEGMGEGDTFDQEPTSETTEES